MHEIEPYFFYWTLIPLTICSQDPVELYEIDFAQHGREHIDFAQHGREYIDYTQHAREHIDLAQYAREYTDFVQHAREYTDFAQMEGIYRFRKTCMYHLKMTTFQINTFSDSLL